MSSTPFTSIYMHFDISIDRLVLQSTKCGTMALMKRARVDKRVFWPQHFRKIEYVCLIGFRLT